jgi:hypothetical protein
MTGQIERVVVPLDAVSENRAAIDAGARLARHWRARLHGVFIEDEDLLRLAGLPFARQVSVGAGAERLTAEHAERQLRAFAEAARRDLAAAAGRHHVRFSFESRRGAPAETMVLSESDFVVACSVTRPIDRHFRIAARSQAIAPAAGSLLLQRSHGTAGAVVAVLRDRRPRTARLLAAAAQFAAAAATRLTVVYAADLARDRGFEQWLDEVAAPHRVPIRIELAPDDAAGLNQRLVELDCGLLALAGDAEQGDPDQLRELTANLGCDILVMR